MYQLTANFTVVEAFALGWVEASADFSEMSFVLLFCWPQQEYKKRAFWSAQQHSHKTQNRVLLSQQKYKWKQFWSAEWQIDFMGVIAFGLVKWQWQMLSRLEEFYVDRCWNLCKSTAMEGDVSVIWDMVWEAWFKQLHCNRRWLRVGVSVRA